MSSTKLLRPQLRGVCGSAGWRGWRRHRTRTRGRTHLRQGERARAAVQPRGRASARRARTSPVIDELEHRRLSGLLKRRHEVIQSQLVAQVAAHARHLEPSLVVGVPAVVVAVTPGDSVPADRRVVAASVIVLLIRLCPPADARQGAGPSAARRGACDGARCVRCGAVAGAEEQFIEIVLSDARAAVSVRSRGRARGCRHLPRVGVPRSGRARRG